MKTTTATEVKQLLDEKAPLLIVDVRDPEAYRSGRLPGAINVPINAVGFEDRIRSLISDPSTLIIPYSSTVACPLSPRAAHLLRRMGFSDVHDLEEGVAGWRAVGLPLASAPSEGRWARILSSGPVAAEA